MDGKSATTRMSLGEDSLIIEKLKKSMNEKKNRLSPQGLVFLREISEHRRNGILKGWIQRTFSSRT